MKKTIKKVISLFSKKVPVKYPIYEGNILEGRVALITGGNSGIGYTIAESFLRNGASVIIAGRDEEKLNSAKEDLLKLKKENADIYSCVMDISKIDDIERNFNNLVSSIGDKKIDILVNNAGVNKGKNIGDTDLQDYKDVIETNLNGTYFLTQVVFNYMKKNKIKGNILNIESSSSIRPAATPYSATKWALKGLTTGMAKKFIKYGIVVNAVAPGPTATPMLLDNLKDGIRYSNSPVERYIMPEEIANVATFLVSDMGKMIVGDTIYVTGGAGTITYDDIEY